MRRLLNLESHFTIYVFSNYWSLYHLESKTTSFSQNLPLYYHTKDDDLSRQFFGSAMKILHEQNLPSLYELHDLTAKLNYYSYHDQ